MYIFNILIATIIISSLIFNTRLSKKDKKNFFFFTITLFLIILIGFRAVDVGSDTLSYIRYFEKITNTSWRNIQWIGDQEPGFVLYTKLIATITKNERFYLLFSALVVQVLVSRFYYVYLDKNYAFAYLIYCGFILPISITAMRQMLAIAIVIQSYKYFKSKELKKFLCVVFIASMFHYTALFFVLLWFARFCSETSKRSFILFIVLGIGLIGFESLGSVIIRYLPSYSQYITYYFNDELPKSTFVKLILFLVLFFISLFLEKKEFKNDEKHSVQLRFAQGILSFAIVLAIIGGRYYQLNRIGYYLAILYPMIFGFILDNTKYKFVGTAMKYGIVVFSIALMNYSILYGTNGILPYSNVLFGD